jgi:tight adherence protein B
MATALASGLVVRALAARRRGPRRSRRATLPGLDVSLSQFWLTVLAAGAVTYLLILALTGLSVVSLVPAVVVAALPRAYFAKRRSQRLVAIIEAWPDGLRDLLGSVRSGASLASAVENLAVFGPEPLREAFHGFDVYSRSLGVIPALEMVKDDLADPTSDRIIEVLILAHQRGGRAIPEILADLAEAVSKDLWTIEQVRTDILEQKINSRVVFVMPWVVLVAMTARSTAFREFYSTRAGLLVVALGGVLSIVGMVIASKLGAQPAEPRVFAGGRST